MAVDLTRALVLIVGLGPDVAVTDVRGRRGGPLRIWVELTGRLCCGACGGPAWAHGSSRVALADLPVFGRPARLVWNHPRLIQLTSKQGEVPRGPC